MQELVNELESTAAKKNVYRVARQMAKLCERCKWKSVDRK